MTLYRNAGSATSAPSRSRGRAADDTFATDVLAGLAAQRKWLAPKYFYDDEGSRLFEEITTLQEYYPTRCELRILREHAAEMAGLLPDGTALIEFGSGSSKKIRAFLAAAPRLGAYIPVDISADFLREQARDLRRDFPGLKILPVDADFTRPFPIPREADGLPRAGFFAGSTIGNFDPPVAADFLRHAGALLGPGATLIIGVDLLKPPSTLHAAYNDSAGVTARFNLNLLRRINRELDANFDLDAFEHYALFNPERQRIEMHLVSNRCQSVRLLDTTIRFRAGESIHTESSYKYTLQSFAALARGAGWRSSRTWTDPDGLFSVHALTATGTPVV